MSNLKNDPRVLTYMTLRKIIGVLGFLLPFVLLIGTYLFSDCATIQKSLSIYYYTAMGDTFVSIMVAIALFLISYKGYDSIENVLTNLAGICAIIIALVPVTQTYLSPCFTRYMEASVLRTIFHYSAAFIFFIILAYLSYFSFTKSKGEMTKEKRQRNVVYKLCGIVIVVAVILIPVFSDLDVPASTFWFEWLAFIAFGISWMTKGELFLKDKGHIEPILKHEHDSHETFADEGAE